MKVRFSTPIVIQLCVVLAAIIYFPAAKAPFFFDDYEYILGNPMARDMAVLCSQWQNAGLKFLTYLTFVANFSVGGYNPAVYHLLNIVLHVINACLLYFLSRQLTRTPQIASQLSPEQSHFIPVAAALFFLAHPVATSAVSYVWQRAELLTTMFYLAAVIFYVIARQDRKKIYFAGTALCFVVGMFAKGTMISLPLTLILLEGALWPASRRKAYTIILTIGGFFFLKAYMYLWEEPWGVYSRMYMVPFMKLTGAVLFYEDVWTQIFVTLKYLGLALFPLSQNFDYDIPRAVSFWEPRICGSALVLFGLIVAAFMLWNKLRMLSVGIYWFLLCLLPAALMGGREPMWEYRMYLPLTGLSVGIVAALLQSFELRKACAGLLIIIVIFSGLTFSRNRLWENPEHLLLDTIAKSPRKPNAYQLLGAVYLQQGRVDEAETYLEKTISLAPDAAESYNNLGLIARNRGDTQKAKDMFAAALRLRPTLTSTYINYAYLVLNEGDGQKAEELLQQSLQVEETEGAYAALGKLYLSRGNLDEAEIFLQKALKINPQASQAYFWYGELWMSRENAPKAIEMFRQAERFNPALRGLVPPGS